MYWPVAKEIWFKYISIFSSGSHVVQPKLILLINFGRNNNKGKGLLQTVIFWKLQKEQTFISCLTVMLSMKIFVTLWHFNYWSFYVIPGMEIFVIFWLFQIMSENSNAYIFLTLFGIFQNFYLEFSVIFWDWVQNLTLTKNANTQWQLKTLPRVDE